MVQYAVPRVWLSVGGKRKMGTMWDERVKISQNYCLRSKERVYRQREITLPVIDTALCAFACMYFAHKFKWILYYN